MMSTCTIELDNSKTHYQPGDMIEGRVKCSFNHSITISGINIELVGKESNQWISEKENTSNVIFKGENKFLDVEINLQKGGDAGPESFEYPFSIQIPSNIPSTYHGKYGGVLFTLQAKVDTLLKTECSGSIEIGVFSPINLNEIRNYIQLGPLSYTDSRTLSGWFCNNGLITMNAQLEKKLFVPGDTAQMKVYLKNDSSEVVESVTAEIGMVIESITANPHADSKYDFQIMAREVAPKLKAHKHKQEMYNFQLKIPEDAVLPNFLGCKLFRIWFGMKVTAVMPKYTDLNIIIAITLGHIPLDPQIPHQGAGLQQEPIVTQPRPLSNNTAPHHLASPDIVSMPNLWLPYPPPPPVDTTCCDNNGCSDCGDCSDCNGSEDCCCDGDCDCDCAECGDMCICCLDICGDCTS